MRHLRLSTHLKSPQRRIPSLEDFPGLVLRPGLLVVSHSRTGPVAGTFSRKRFSEEPLRAASPHVSGPGNRAAGPASSIRTSRHPVTRRCRFTEAVRALNPSPTPDGITETRQPATPPPRLRARFGVRGGTLRSIPSSALKAIGRSSYPGPAGLIAVVGLSWIPLADTPEHLRPPRPSRTRKASRLTGYLNASG